MGELIKGNGSGFDKYHELDSYKPFYDKRDMKDVATWANWRREGVERVVDDQCPCCTKKLPNEIEDQNTLIEKVFKKSALSTATAVLDYLKKAGDSGFVSTDAINEIENFIGDSSKASELHAALSRLGTETQYLSNKIEHIFQFRPMNVTHEQLEQIDRCLEELKISKTIIDKYYCTPAIIGLVDIVDAKVDELKENTRKLKNLFEAHEKKLNKTATPTTTHGNNVESIPKDKPLIITVPAPVSELDANFLVGLYVSEVNLSVKNPIAVPEIRPETREKNIDLHCGKNIFITI